jgi:hypothetical protein
MPNRTPPKDMTPAGLDDRLCWYADVARLAPSKHNAQPWRFVVRGGVLEVWSDELRRLPATDPAGRELAISCGAAVQTAVVAAGALGVALKVSVATDAGGPLAWLREAGVRIPTDHDRALLAAVTRRRTDRGPLDMSVLDSTLPFRLQDLAEAHGCTLRLVSSPGDRSGLARAVELAHHQLLRNPDYEAELAEWVRSPIDLRRDGVPADATRGPGSSNAAEFVQRDFGLPGVAATHDRDEPDAPLVAILCSRTDGVTDWVQSGRALMDVLLEATVAGASASYINQPVELQQTRDLLRTQLDLPGPAQLILRLGAGAIVPATPRRAAHEVISRG